MKFKIILTVLMITLITGCSSKSDEKSLSETTITSQQEDYIKDIAKDMGVTEETTEFTPLAPSSDIADYDLTTLDIDTAYTETINMSNNPYFYEGKTIRLKGTYDTQYSADTDTNYHFIMVNDSDGCIGGLEFILANTSDTSNEYPQIDTPIEIIGTYESYEENGSPYFYINTDKIITSQN